MEIYIRSLLFRFIKQHLTRPKMSETENKISVDRSGNNSRAKIYRRNMWLCQLHAPSSVPPYVLKRNAHKIHYLKPWISREIQAINPYLGEKLWDFFVNLVFELIQKFKIKGQEFKSLIDIYTYPYTDHFMHELDAFVKSGYPMDAYDYAVTELYQ